MVTFDGTARLITVDTSEDLAVIYSEWKRWVIADNANYPPAFSQLGGDDLGGGVSLGIYLFIRNDKGWRIQPAGTAGELQIEGNLFPIDTGVPYTLAPEVGDYAYFRFISSSLTQVASSGNTECFTETDRTVLNITRDHAKAADAQTQQV